MSDQIKYGYYWMRTVNGDKILEYGDNGLIVGWWWGNDQYPRIMIISRLSPEPITNPYI